MILGAILKVLLKPILNKKVLFTFLGVLILVVLFVVFKGRVFAMFTPNNTTAEVVPPTEYVCPDGTKVLKLADCPQRRNSTDNNTTTMPDVPSRPAEKPPEEPIPTEDPIYVDITGWTQTEIVQAMAVVNPAFRGVTYRKVLYTQGKVGYYWREGNPNNPIEDPFWLLRNQYFDGSIEYTVNNLRSNVYEMPDYYLSLVNSRKEDAKLKILDYATWADWKSITCQDVPTCRNLLAINCTRGTHTFYAWNYLPERENTIAYRFTMTAMDDRGASFKTFEAFYCEPV
ncbi:MAG: hypothetical protein ABIA93_02495 [Candidatus Woesearchaeota archaeon]